MKRLTTLKKSRTRQINPKLYQHSKHKQSNFIWTILKRQKEENFQTLFKRPASRQYQNYVNTHHQQKLHAYMPNKNKLKNI